MMTPEMKAERKAVCIAEGDAIPIQDVRDKRPRITPSQHENLGDDHSTASGSSQWQDTTNTVIVPHQNQYSSTSSTDVHGGDGGSTLGGNRILEHSKSFPNPASPDHIMLIRHHGARETGIETGTKCRVRDCFYVRSMVRASPPLDDVTATAQ